MCVFVQVRRIEGQYVGICVCLSIFTSVNKTELIVTTRDSKSTVNNEGVGKNRKAKGRKAN